MIKVLNKKINREKIINDKIRNKIEKDGRGKHIESDRDIETNET